MPSPTPPQYRMPAEWEPHAATWLAWPHFRGDWPGKFDPIPWVYAEVIRNLTPHERVELVVQDAATEVKARKILDRAGALSKNLRFHRWKTDRIWTRDSGCIYVAEVSKENKAAKLRAVHFGFNAWAKYPNYTYDAKLGALMARTAKAQVLSPKKEKHKVALEGGSIDVNGQGVLLTTEECLLSKVQERNPGFSRADYERMFADYLGIAKVIWLGKGIEGDDTHGHVDDLSRFVAPDTVLTMVELNKSDPNHEILADNIRRLRAATDQNGRKFQVVKLPMPRRLTFEGRRLPASYGNFYIANGVVLAPVFNDPNDRIALNMLAELFPTREIIPIYSGDFIWGLGAMHCMSQQQPALK
jgi:agmatine deiminase